MTEQLTTGLDGYQGRAVIAGILAEHEAIAQNLPFGYGYHFIKTNDPLTYVDTTTPINVQGIYTNVNTGEPHLTSVPNTGGSISTWCKPGAGGVVAQSEGVLSVDVEKLGLFVFVHNAAWTQVFKAQAGMENYTAGRWINLSSEITPAEFMPNFRENVVGEDLGCDEEGKIKSTAGGVYYVKSRVLIAA